MLGRPGLMIGLALTMGFFTTATVSKYLKSEKAVGPAVVHEIVIAKSDIPAGSEIKKEMLTTIRWYASKLPAGCFEKPKDLEGKKTVVAIKAGEPVVASMLRQKKGDEIEIPKGMRIFTLPLDNSSGIAALLEPGSRVDVLVSYTPPGASGPTTEWVAQNVRVLKVGVKGKDKRKFAFSTRRVPVLLLVTPDQASDLAAAMTVGRVTVVLRGENDESVAQNLPRFNPNAETVQQEASQQSTSTAGLSADQAQQLMDTAKDWIKVGRYDLARKILQRIVSEGANLPQAPAAYELLKNCEQELAKQQKQAELVRLVAEARKAVESGEFKKAKDILSELKSNFSPDEKLPDGSGTVGDEIATLQAKLDQGIKQARMLLCFGQNYLKLGRIEKARYYLERLRVLYPNSEEYRKLATELGRQQSTKAVENQQASCPTGS